MATKRKSDTFTNDEASSSSFKRAKKSSSETVEGNNSASTSKQIDDNGDTFWDLNASGTRRVTLSKFKGNVLVNVREWYDSGGKMMPGKKGISLTMEQFSAMLEMLPQIEKELDDMGQTVPRPVYDGQRRGKDQEGDDGMEEEDDEDAIERGKREGSSRKNFEATSSEGED